ncbi:MAG: hypothetical protein DRJ42_22725 [Deltaproteobacteria bacterium]|nr:MAG: hypothetical protein DRJ42_22725 [Deltaproteobacteria bacterium]
MEWQPLREGGLPEEARGRLAEIFVTLVSYHAAPDRSGASGRFPADQSRVPTTVPCEPVSYDFTQHKTWRDLGFAPYEAQSYAYELLIDRDAATWRARVFADTDCDAVPVVYELRGAMNDDGMLYREPDFWVLRPDE